MPDTRSHELYLVFALLISVLLTACVSSPPVDQPTFTPTETPKPQATASSTPDARKLSDAYVRYAAPDCDYGGALKAIEVFDDLTVKFTLCAPDVAFPAKVALPAFAIHPSEHLEATGGGGAELIANPIGTGPYMLDAWQEGESVTLTRNPDYWGEPAKTETLVFRWDKDSAARLLELQAGIVDGIDAPNPDDFALIESDDTLTLYPRPALNVFYLGLNRDHAPLDNDLVRQALAMGIDRQRIVDNFYPAGSEAASHFAPCAIPGGCEGDAWYEYDPEQAKELLKQAGFENGFEIELSYRDVARNYLPEPTLVAQDIQAQLQELGITANLNPMESRAFLDASDRGELGMFLLGWAADYPDQTNFLDYHFGEGASALFGAGFPGIWTRLARAASLDDPVERNALYADANNLIREHVPMIPVAHGGSATAFKADVEGAHASPMGSEHFASMTPGERAQLVWMQSAEPLSLYCADETDGESFRACEQINESLLAYEVGGAVVRPALAESYSANASLTEWTFKLRPDVKFHDGSTLDARDVLLSFVVQWDAAHPLHKGRDGSFPYFSGHFGQFLNALPGE